MSKVSVIIPAYNTPSAFFKQCIESLQGQTLGDIEIIVIDDGSSPESNGSEAPCIQLVKAYASQDTRIKFLQQNHKGVSEARNLGIQNSTGEYIVFLDSDDWFDLDTLESLYDYATAQNSDITIFENYRNTATAEVSFKAFQHNVEHFEGSSLYELIKNAVQTNPKHCGIIIGVCCKFYRKSFLENNSLLFKCGISLGEDRMFFLKALCHKPSLSYLARPFYHYRESEGSLSQALRKDFGTILVDSEKYLCQLPIAQVYGIPQQEYLSWVYTDFARIIWASLLQYYLNPKSKDSFFATRKHFMDFIRMDVSQKALSMFNRDAFGKRDLLKLILCKKRMFSLLYLFKIKLALQKKILCHHK